MEVAASNSPATLTLEEEEAVWVDGARSSMDLIWEHKIHTRTRRSTNIGAVTIIASESTHDPGCLFDAFIDSGARSFMSCLGLVLSNNERMWPVKRRMAHPRRICYYLRCFNCCKLD